MWDSDLLYEGHKVVPYCARCGTALSSHEVAQGYKDVEDPSRLRPLPGRRAAPARCARATRCSCGRRRRGRWSPTRRSRSTRSSTYVRTADGEVLAEALVERVLGEDAEVADRFPGREMLGARYEPPFAFIPAEECGREGPHRRCPATSSPPTTAPASSTPRSRSARTTTGSAPEQGLAVVNPVRLDGTYDERIGPYAGRWVKDADADLDRGPARARPAAARGALPARLPALLALRHAAALLRQAVLVHPHVGDARPPARRQRDGRLAPAAHQARPLRQVAREQRRLGDLARALLGHAAARVALRERPRGVRSARSPRSRSARGRELPDPHRPYVDEHTWPCAECGEEMRRVPEVIDVWFDSGSMPFAQRHAPFENEDAVRARRSPRTTSARRSTRRAAGSTR